MKADIIVKGTIYNGIDTNPSAEMFAVKEGAFCYIGSLEKQSELQDEHTKVIELTEEMVLPGMFEGHAHVSSGIDLYHGVNLYGLNTLDRYLEAVREYIEKNCEQDFIIGRGFVNGDFGQEGPTAVMLDQITEDKYIILDSEDCHSSWVNSKVLRAAEINEHTKELKNGVIVRYQGSNQPTGWLKETEMQRVKKLLPGYGIKDYKEAILKYQEMAISYGIVCSYEPIMNDKHDIDLRVRAYYELDQEEKLVMQFRAGITMDPREDNDATLEKLISLREMSKGPHFELMGIKVFIDGVVEGHTAFLREPYADQPEDCGHNMWEQEKLNSLFVKAAELNVPIHVHAIGDAAIDSALEAFEEAYHTTGHKDMQNCITHVQVVAEDQFIRFQKLGIIAVTNPFWHTRNPSYYDCLEVPFLGKERADLEYPLKSFFKHGIVVTQASDWPVTYYCDPFIGLEVAVTRRESGITEMESLNEVEAVSVEQMLKALTMNGAYQMRSGTTMGSIEVGKRANFVIINQNVFQVSKEKIGKTSVLQHYIDGKEVYHRLES